MCIVTLIWSNPKGLLLPKPSSGTFNGRVMKGAPAGSSLFSALIVCLAKPTRFRSILGPRPPERYTTLIGHIVMVPRWPSTVRSNGYTTPPRTDL